MKTYRVHVEASKAGALALYTEKREYIIKCENEEFCDTAVRKAIDLAHDEGLEHVKVVGFTHKKDKRS